MINNQTVHIAVSSCLLGNPVRYDGSDCANSYIIGTLSKFLKLVPVCPENAIGLGTPRPPIQLVMLKNDTAVRGVEDNNLDVTRELAAFAQGFRHQHPQISGFVLKSRSPSCGVKSTKIFDTQGQLIHEQASGMFAASLSDEKNALPVTAEDRLLDSNHRLDFLVRVIAISRLQHLSSTGNAFEPLFQYHHRYRPLLQTLSGDYIDWFESSILFDRPNEATSLIKTYQAYVTPLLSHCLDRRLFHEIIVFALDLANGKHSDCLLQKRLASFKEGAIEWSDILKDLQQRSVDRYSPFELLSEYCPLPLLFG